jgi:hypothetical protein
MSKPLLWLLLMLATPAAAQTVHSLDKVPAALKTPEAKAAFAQQIEGQAAPDGLGARLPGVLSAAQITGLLVPLSDKTPPSLVGARPLPGQPGVFVAIVCTGGNPPGPSDDKQCDQTNFGAPRPDMHVYVGPIEAKAGSPPHLIAKPMEVDTRVNWNTTILEDTPDELDDAKDGLLVPDYITSFDLAPYVIAPGQRAFGLIGAWNVGYAGGGAQYSALYLFAVVDGAVSEILATPMSFSKDLAGDWHKDGTRDHELSEGANILLVTSHMTNGHFDLLQKARTTKARHMFKWSAAANRYEWGDE